jgi:hypothetical protein
VNYEQRLGAERWIAWIRVAAVPFAILQAALVGPYPPGREAWTWATVGVFAVGAGVLLYLSRRPLVRRDLERVRLAAVVFDFAIVSSLILALSFERATPTRQLMIVVAVEAAVRFGIRGGLALVAASAPVLFGAEWLRSDYFDDSYRWTTVTVQLGIELITVLIVGWLVQQLRTEARRALDRANEAEELRDELGRRADLLDAANRCARALGSSLELDEAFGAFIRELRSLIPFDRTAIILMEEGHVRVMATAGHMADDVLRPGEALPPGALIEEVLRTGETVYRRDMTDHLYPEEVTLTAIGLRSRVAAPLLLGARPIGMVAILRRVPEGFGPDEIELAGLLGRLVATAVQNIRSYESERETVE